LSLQEKLPDSNNFSCEYSTHNVTCRTSEICIEIRKNVKKHPQHYRYLKKHNQILILFGLTISDTTGYWMIV